MRRLILGLLLVFAWALAGCEGDEHREGREWRGQQYPYGYAPDGYYPPYGYVPPDGYYDGRDGRDRRDGRDGYERGEEREERAERERR
jgi:hypothetical protein